MENLLDRLFAAIPYDRLRGINPRAMWGIVAAIPLLIVGLVYLLVASPVMDDVNRLSEELAKASREVSEKEDLQERLPELKAQNAELEAEIGELRRQLPEKKDIPDLLDSVSKIGFSAGLEFQVFKPQPEIEKDFYAEVPFDIVVTGTFHNLVAFFNEVSRMSRIVAFPNVTITRGIKKAKGAAPGAPVTAVCRAVTFRFLEAKAAVKAEEGTKAK
jgi:type IV pilus assembly protein PilO